MPIVGQLEPMKPFAELTSEDFRRSPVWRYESKGGDVTAMAEEVGRSLLSEGDSGVFVVATTFRLADGSELMGLCSPADSSGLDYLQPILFAPGHQLPLWAEGEPSGVPPTAISERLGRRVSEVFPMVFTCHVPVDGRLVSGTIDVGWALPNQALQLLCGVQEEMNEGERGTVGTRIRRR